MASSICVFVFYITLIYANSANTIVCPTTSSPTAAPVTPEPTRSTGSATPKPTQYGGGDQVQETEEPAASTAQCDPNKLDTIILNDVTCAKSTAQCQFQQRQLWKILKYLKPEDHDTGVEDHVPGSRVAYIEFDGTDTPKTYITLKDQKYNIAPVDASDIESLESDIIDAVNCADCSSSAPNLQEAIKFAIDQFTDSDEKLRQKKIIIFSHNKAENVEEICNDNVIQTAIRNKKNNAHSLDVNIYMVNIGDNFSADDLYIMCLVEYDADKLYHIEIGSGKNSDDLDYFQNALCSTPTRVPTMDPTVDPTSDPTSDPTESQVESRRMMGSDNEFDITSGFDSTPCIEMNIKLETENLLPVNSNPDPVSNIVVIAKAIAGLTLGSVTIPEPYDPEENDTISNPNVEWEIDDSCVGTTIPQMSQTWMPSNVTAMQLNFTVTEQPNGFLAVTDLQTEDSIMYMTLIDALSFSMSHDCDEGDLMVQGVINEDDGTLVAATQSVSISSNNGGSHTFAFDSTVRLYPSTLYQVQFELVNDYPAGCGFNNLQFGASSRRRLDSSDEDDDETTYATLQPDACLLGQNLAKSEAMRAGAEAMCNPNLMNARKSQIEEGLFRQHISQSAMHNHLFKTGSLHLFDARGIETFNTTDFPAYDVSDPCVAIDEEYNIIFAIGGHINGIATNKIQAYQFNDSNLTHGAVLDVGNWLLDNNRYGATCFFWRDSSNSAKIIVISGMETVAEEFKSRGKWHKDIRLFAVPDFIYDQSLSKDAFIPPSFPTEGTYSLPYNIIDPKPLLYNNHKLYLFGGKTHKSSKAFVTLMDLNNIGNNANDPNFTLLAVQTMELGEDRALPLTDLVDFNGSSCYMVFKGAQYADTKRVNATSELVQLFCNPSVTSNVRRRLIEDEAPTITAFDRQMMEEGERRRLQDDDVDARGEVLWTKYEYTLDGVWYNFSVNFELCYADNEKLREAVDHYRSIEQGKPDDFTWVHFKEETADEILRISRQVYEGWSDGFGAVQVWDFDIIEVRPDDTPSPTAHAELSHPERRKARQWWNHCEEEDDDENFIWIDEQFDDDDIDDEDR